jgi:hypothetical protein
MSVLLRFAGRDCDLRCHRAVPGTPCDCICRGAYHAVGSTDAATRKLIADQGLADLDNEQLASLLAVHWGPEDAEGITPELLGRARKILGSASEERRTLLVASVARAQWQVEAVVQALDAAPGAQPMRPELG